MKKIFYGKSDFAYIREQNGYYIDKTQFIEKIESMSSEYLFFFRPRRFGKSLFLSTLEHYYDINRKDYFERLFGDLYIGKNPTPLRNTYPILKFNFSGITSEGPIESIKDSFNAHIWNAFNSFFIRYAHILNFENPIKTDIEPLKEGANMLARFNSILSAYDIKYYLLIDEYDNFANNLLAQYGKDKYYEITHGTGFLRGFFNVIKAGTDSSTIARIFATGVTPLLLSDVTSGFNIGDNISVNSDFHNLAGFTETDVQEIVDYHIEHGLISETIRELLLYTMKKYYDGYLFSPELTETLYNSTAVWYLLKQYHTANKAQKNKLPRTIIDSNLMTDYKKLEFLVVEEQRLNGNYKNLSDLLLTEQCEDELVDTFSVRELSESSKFISFLYYLGLISIKGEGFFNTIFTIPNEACRHMLWEYIRTALNSVFDIDFSRLVRLFSDFAGKGLWKPYFERVFEQAYDALSNRDFIDGESVIKGVMLGYLTQTNAYIVRSEKELNKGYTDLYLEPLIKIHPKICPTHYLVELKYIKTGDITEATKQNRIETAKAEATKQLERYAKGLNLKNVPVKKIIIIASNTTLLLLEETP